MLKLTDFIPDKRTSFIDILVKLPKLLSVGFEIEGVGLRPSDIKKFPQSQIWAEHYDATVQFEYGSPVLILLPGHSYVRHFLEMIDESFGFLARTENKYPVYYAQVKNWSAGRHMHFGLADKSLKFEDALRLADAIRWFNPLLIAISSSSITHNYFCRRLYKSVVPPDSSRTGDGYAHVSVPGRLPSNHYAELNGITEHGTLEYRTPDSSTFQQTSAVLFITGELYKFVMNGGVVTKMGRRQYIRERNKAIIKGFDELDTAKYLSMLISYIGDQRIDDLPQSTKEILYLAFVMKTNAIQLIHSLNLKASGSVAKELTANPFEFTSVLKEFVESEHRGLLSEIHDSAAQLKKLSDLGKVNLVVVAKHNPRVLYQLYLKDREQFEKITRESKKLQKYSELFDAIRRLDMEKLLEFYSSGARDELSAILDRVVYERIVRMHFERTNSKVEELVERHGFIINRISFIEPLKIKGVVNDMEALTGRSFPEMSSANERYYPILTFDPSTRKIYVAAVLRIRFVTGEAKIFARTERIKERILPELQEMFNFLWSRRDMNEATFRLVG